MAESSTEYAVKSFATEADRDEWIAQNLDTAGVMPPDITEEGRIVEWGYETADGWKIIGYVYIFAGQVWIIFPIIVPTN